MLFARGADRTSVTCLQLTADPRLFRQDGAAEAAANLFLRSDVPAPVFGQEEHQPLGFVLLLLRKQVELDLIWWTVSISNGMLKLLKKQVLSKKFERNNINLQVYLMGFLPFFVTSSKCLKSLEMLPSSGKV